jgi:Peptidase family C25
MCSAYPAIAFLSTEWIKSSTVDLGDPRTAGWTFLVNGNDPQYSAIVDALRPLAEYRSMRNSTAPLVFLDESPDEWFDWLLENYSSLIMERVPYYILIVGGPDHVPFRFQSFLATAAAVGRVNFDSIEDLKTYVEKVIRLEQMTSPTALAEAVCFAPDGGSDDATYFSHHYMVKPLADHIQTHCRLKTRAIMGDDATKARLLEVLFEARPALVYTASHGLGALDAPFEVQKRLNGAICCQHSQNDPLENWLFAADDVPLEKTFLEGAVFFQFACFGYGTPSESDFNHWLGRPQLNTSADFVASLPKRLLAHPKGPVAFIGHVDVAWLHGFADPNDPYILERWHPRIEPFVQAVDVLLKVQPVGLAMASMNKRYNIGNALLTSTFDRLQRGKIQMTPEFHTRLVDAFITRSDAQNYFIFGDPGVRLRISED